MTVSNQTITAPDSSTRERIVTEAIRLFARHGFSGTTVGDIEQAAGLAPRAGGLYKHFRSKEEVLSAAIERHVREMERMRARFDVMPLGDLGAELTLAARWALAELGEEQLVMKVVQKDGDRFPELVREVHERIMEPGTRAGRGDLRAHVQRAGHQGSRPARDRGSGARRARRLRARADHVRRPPGGIGEDEFIEAWVDTWETFARGAAMPRAGKEK